LDLMKYGDIAVALTLVQVVYRTEVREIIDHLNDDNVPRKSWIDQIGTAYTVHRLLAYVTLLLTVGYFFVVKSRFSKLSLQSKFAWVTLILIMIQMLSGIILARFDVPAFAQTTHLVIASLFFGAQFYLMLLMTKSKI